MESSSEVGKELERRCRWSNPLKTRMTFRDTYSCQPHVTLSLEVRILVLVSFSHFDSMHLLYFDNYPGPISGKHKYNVELCLYHRGNCWPIECINIKTVPKIFLNCLIKKFILFKFSPACWSKFSWELAQSNIFSLLHNLKNKRDKTWCFCDSHSVGSLESYCSVSIGGSHYLGWSRVCDLVHLLCTTPARCRLCTFPTLHANVLIWKNGPFLWTWTFI